MFLKEIILSLSPCPHYHKLEFLSNNHFILILLPQRLLAYQQGFRIYFYLWFFKKTCLLLV